MEKIVVICGGGHARVIVSILKKMGKFDIQGYVDLEDNGSLLGAPYLGQDSVLGTLFAEQGITNAVIGLGQTTSRDRRR